MQSYGDPSQHQVMIRVPQVGAESGASLSSTKDVSRRRAARRQPRQLQASSAPRSSGPTVGQELTSKGIWATVLSLVGILLYLAFRFQFSFGVGAVVATIHDLLITLAFLAFFRYDMTLNVIAAILTMTGYLDQRHDRHLRPDPREPAVDAPRLDATTSSTCRSTRRSAGPSSRRARRS